MIGEMGGGGVVGTVEPDGTATNAAAARTPSVAHRTGRPRRGCAVVAFPVARFVGIRARWAFT